MKEWAGDAADQSSTLCRLDRLQVFRHNRLVTVAFGAPSGNGRTSNSPER